LGQMVAEKLKAGRTPLHARCPDGGAWAAWRSQVTARLAPIFVALLLAACTGASGTATARPAVSPNVAPSSDMVTARFTSGAVAGVTVLAPTASTMRMMPVLPASVAGGVPSPTAPASTPAPPPSATPEATPTLPAVSAPTAAAVGRQAGREAVYYTSGQRSHMQIWRLDLDTLQASRLYGSDEPGFEVEYLSPSPDGALLAFEADVRDPRAPDYLAESAIMLMRSDGSQVLTVTEAPGPQEAVVNPQWSPDGALLAYSHEHENPDCPTCIGPTDLHVYDPKDGGDRVVSADGGLYFSWSADSTQIAVSEWYAREGLSVLNLSAHQQRVVWEDPGLAFMEEAWQPGGNQIAVAVSAVGGAKTEAQAGLYLVSATTGQRRRLVPGRADGIHWSPDGNLLYYCDVGEASHPWLFDLAAGRATMLLHTAIAWSSSSPWSPRGDALLLALEEKPRRAYSIAIMTLPNRQLFPLAPVESVYPDPTW